MHSFRLSAVALVLSVAAWPQQMADKKPGAPVDPCPAATTDMARTQCWEDLGRKADANLTALYQKLQKLIRDRIAQETVPQLKQYQETALAKLKAAQLAFSRYRAAQCDADQQQYEGGTIAPSVRAGCVKHLSEQRMEELQKTYAIYFHRGDD